MERLLPCDGDVLVSHPMARVECEIEVIPCLAHEMHQHEASALTTGVNLARALGVDAWLTYDRRHFLRVASFREGPRGTSPTLAIDTPSSGSHAAR